MHMYSIVSMHYTVVSMHFEFRISEIGVLAMALTLIGGQRQMSVIALTLTPISLFLFSDLF